jgi:hypothetical protein
MESLVALRRSLKELYSLKNIDNWYDLISMFLFFCDSIRF